MRQVRCAIYTRKSSEEGLEQDFNSLHAQRDACAAYILSQASEGWTALPDVYDDGGLSGGSLERPALQRLLGDIDAGRIDIIVVYKVDRLTRSLLDFAKLVEIFDRADVSFVSITQSFNTTTSMGRLTLNMLLSFAQFEREVTAERIRDKIAASKARGMWMGGLPPLGYAPDGRTLRIVPEHAALVRRIYDRYLALGNVRLVADELARDEVFTPLRMLRSGRGIGGCRFSRGQLYTILRSPIYVGDIPHKGTTHSGLHAPIIDRGTWDQVQTMLANNIQGQRRGRRSSSLSPLAGKVVTASGVRLVASHACKGAKRYRYYVTAADAPGPALRIPARELEAAVAECLADALDDPLELCTNAELVAEPSILSSLCPAAAALAARLRTRERSLLQDLVSSVRILDDGIEVECYTRALANALGIPHSEDDCACIRLRLDIRLRRSGHVMRMVHTSGAKVAAHPSASLVSLLLKARRWWATLRSEGINIATLADRENVTRSYVTRVVRLAFLSPAVVEAILAGTMRAEVDGRVLLSAGAISASWQEQSRLLPNSGR